MNNTLFMGASLLLAALHAPAALAQSAAAAKLLPALPEVLRYVAGPLQAMTGGRLDAAILRQLLIALAMIVVMLVRPRGLWPAPDHGKSLQQSR